jgi:hypothetical protein
MISKEDALVDLQKVETDARGDVAKILIGIAQILIKLLATIRSNQILCESDKIRIKAERVKKLNKN